MSKQTVTEVVLGTDSRGRKMSWLDVGVAEMTLLPAASPARESTYPEHAEYVRHKLSTCLWLDDQKRGLNFVWNDKRFGLHLICLEHYIYTVLNWCFKGLCSSNNWCTQATLGSLGRSYTYTCTTGTYMYII